MPEHLGVVAVGRWGWDVVQLLTVPALVLLNGFFVAAEFALVAVRRTQVEEMVRQGQARARALLLQVEHLDRYIAATQLGITVASIALGWFGEPALAHLLGPLFGFVPDPDARAAATHSTAATVVAFAVITFLHVVGGELAPKAMALQRPGAVALWVSLPLEAFTRLTRPVVLVMNGTGNWLVRRFGFAAVTERDMVHSVEELTLLVDEVEEAGLLSADQADFVQNVFKLSKKKIGECLVPRDKMATLELHTPPDQILDVVRRGAHTRLPVYDGDPDKVVGIVNTKDLFYLFSLKGVVVLEDALYPAMFLRPDQPVADALRIFRRSRRHMAMVRDADDKIVGLITLEDVLEEIVGEIEDEHDQPAAKARLQAGSAAPRKPAGK